MTLELTTTFRNVSTAGGKEPAKAAASASAHLRYIDRWTAVEDQASSNLDGAPTDQRRALRAAFRMAAEKGGKRGSRVAEKIVVTLPNSWPREARKEALSALCTLLAPPGSDALAYGVTHCDKRDAEKPNEHLHIVALDGPESREAAIARVARGDVRRDEHKHAEAAVIGKPIKTRVKRRNVIRLGDKHRAKELRAEIAGALNEIANRRGLERVEHRSFKERGIDRPPTIKEGHTVRQGHDPGGRRAYNAKIRATRAQEDAELEDFLSSDGVGGMPIDEMFGDDPGDRDKSRPPAGWVPQDDDDDGDAAFNKAEARRQAVRDAAERAENARVAKEIKKAPRTRGRAHAEGETLPIGPAIRRKSKILPA